MSALAQRARAWLAAWHWRRVAWASARSEGRVDVAVSGGSGGSLPAATTSPSSRDADAHTTLRVTSLAPRVPRRASSHDSAAPPQPPLPKPVALHDTRRAPAVSGSITLLGRSLATSWLLAVPRLHTELTLHRLQLVVHAHDVALTLESCPAAAASGDELPDLLEQFTADAVASTNSLPWHQLTQAPALCATHAQSNGSDAGNEFGALPALEDARNAVATAVEAVAGGEAASAAAAASARAAVNRLSQQLVDITTCAATASLVYEPSFAGSQLAALVATLLPLQSSLASALVCDARLTLPAVTQFAGLGHAANASLTASLRAVQGDASSTDAGLVADALLQHVLRPARRLGADAAAPDLNVSMPQLVALGAANSALSDWWPAAMTAVMAAAEKAAASVPESYAVDSTSNGMEAELLSHRFQFVVVGLLPVAFLLVCILPCAWSSVVRDAHRRQVASILQHIATTKRIFMRYQFHEVRVPFNSIMLGLEVLRAEMQDDPSSASFKNLELLDSMKESADTMLRVMNDSVDIDRIEYGQFTLSPSWCNMVAAVESVRAALVPFATARHIEMDLQVVNPQAVHRLYADKHRLRQVLTNLVSNAVKFSHRHSTVHITLSMEEVCEPPALSDGNASDCSGGSSRRRWSLAPPPAASLSPAPLDVWPTSEAQLIQDADEVRVHCLSWCCGEPARSASSMVAPLTTPPAPPHAEAARSMTLRELVYALPYPSARSTELEASTPAVSAAEINSSPTRIGSSGVSLCMAHTLLPPTALSSSAAGTPRSPGLPLATRDATVVSNAPHNEGIGSGDSTPVMMCRPSFVTRRMHSSERTSGRGTSTTARQSSYGQAPTSELSTCAALSAAQASPQLGGFPLPAYSPLATFDSPSRGTRGTTGTVRGQWDNTASLSAQPPLNRLDTGGDLMPHAADMLSHPVGSNDDMSLVASSGEADTVASVHPRVRCDSEPLHVPLDARARLLMYAASTSTPVPTAERAHLSAAPAGMSAAPGQTATTLHAGASPIRKRASGRSSAGGVTLARSRLRRASLSLPSHLREGWAKLTISVQDAGVGISPQDLHHLFVPFVQVAAGVTDEKKSLRTGLGLALSKRIMTLHGGTLHVASSVGAGSTFTMTVILRASFLTYSSSPPPPPPTRLPSGGQTSVSDRATTSASPLRHAELPHPVSSGSKLAPLTLSPPLLPTRAGANGSGVNASNISGGGAVVRPPLWVSTSLARSQSHNWKPTGSPSTARSAASSAAATTTLTTSRTGAAASAVAPATVDTPADADASASTFSAQQLYTDTWAGLIAGEAHSAADTVTSRQTLSSLGSGPRMGATLLSVLSSARPGGPSSDVQGARGDKNACTPEHVYPPQAAARTPNAQDERTVASSNAGAGAGARDGSPTPALKRTLVSTVVSRSAHLMEHVHDTTPRTSWVQKLLPSVQEHAEPRQSTSGRWSSDTDMCAAAESALPCTATTSTAAAENDGGAHACADPVLSGGFDCTSLPAIRMPRQESLLSMVGKESCGNVSCSPCLESTAASGSPLPLQLLPSATGSYTVLDSSFAFGTPMSAKLRTSTTSQHSVGGSEGECSMDALELVRCAGLRALVVDDIATNRKLLARVLQSCGVESTMAANGIEAVDLMTPHLAAASRAPPASPQPPMDDTVDVTMHEPCGSAASVSMLPSWPLPALPHFICMDKEMPLMDGAEATRALRALGYQGTIIGVTANALVSDQTTFVAAGLDALLLKPVDKEALAQVICDHVLNA